VRTRAALNLHYGHTAMVVAMYEFFQRDRGGWLIHRSIFNSDLPAPAP
jgi:hypothetical protein